MEKYLINGGHKLNGSVSISGAKNAAGAIIPATVLVRGKCVIENVPDISDVNVLVEVLKSFGATVEGQGTSTLTIDCTAMGRNVVADFDSLRKFGLPIIYWARCWVGFPVRLFVCPAAVIWAPDRLISILRVLKVWAQMWIWIYPKK